MDFSPDFIDSLYPQLDSRATRVDDEPQEDEPDDSGEPAPAPTA